VKGVVTDYADPLAKDEKLRKRLVEALTTGAAARERARKQMGVTGVARRLAGDPVLRAQLNELAAQLRLVQRRVEKKQSHKARNTVLFIAGAGMVAVAVVPAARNAITSLFGGGQDEWSSGEWPQSTHVDGSADPTTATTTAPAEPQGPAH
jgi:hypothetical protein